MKRIIFLTAVVLALFRAVGMFGAKHSKQSKYGRIETDTRMGQDVPEE